MEEEKNKASDVDSLSHLLDEPKSSTSLTSAYVRSNILSLDDLADAASTAFFDCSSDPDAVSGDHHKNKNKRKNDAKDNDTINMDSNYDSATKGVDGTVFDLNQSATTSQKHDKTEVHTTKCTERDVLMGRGKRVSEWPGNILFRSIVAKYRTIYRQKKRNYKISVAIDIINEIETVHGGRFLNEVVLTSNTDNDTSTTIKDNTNNCPSTLLWTTVDRSRVIEKTCQALREKDRDSPSPPTQASATSSTLATLFTKNKATSVSKIAKLPSTSIQNRRRHPRLPLQTPPKTSHHSSSSSSSSIVSQPKHCDDDEIIEKIKKSTRHVSKRLRHCIDNSEEHNAGMLMMQKRDLNKKPPSATCLKTDDNNFNADVCGDIGAKNHEDLPVLDVKVGSEAGATVSDLIHNSRSSSIDTIIQGRREQTPPKTPTSHQNGDNNYMYGTIQNCQAYQLASDDKDKHGDDIDEFDDTQADTSTYAYHPCSSNDSEKNKYKDSSTENNCVDCNFDNKSVANTTSSITIGTESMSINDQNLQVELHAFRNLFRLPISLFEKKQHTPCLY